MGKAKVRVRDPILVAFGLAVQQRRKILGISQEEAAARSGLHRTYFADVERGARNLGLKNVVAISRGLGVTTPSLLRDIR